MKKAFIVGLATISAIVLAVLGMIYYSNLREKAAQDDLNSRFGNISLTPEEVDEYANQLVNGKDSSVGTSQTDYENVLKDFQGVKDNEMLDTLISYIDILNGVNAIYGSSIDKIDIDNYKEGHRIYFETIRLYNEFEYNSTVHSINTLFDDKESAAAMLEPINLLENKKNSRLEGLESEIYEELSNTSSEINVTRLYELQKECLDDIVAELNIYVETKNELGI